MRVRILSLFCAASLSACSNAGYEFYDNLSIANRAKIDREAEIWANENCAAAQVQACKENYIRSRDTRIAINRLYDTAWNEMNYQQNQFIYGQMQGECGENQGCIAANLQARDAKFFQKRQADAEERGQQLILPKPLKTLKIEQIR